MTEPKWTPGPWKAVNLDDPTIFPSVVLHEVASRRPASITINEGPSREMIRGGGSYGGTTTETATANARLIAAAPTIYDALKALADAHEVTIAGEGYDREHCNCPVLDTARIALAKARGEKP